MTETLIKKAFEAREKAYAPYSGFRVGAALLCSDGSIFTGCNIENASYSATNCAERTAFFTAISKGQRDFVAIAIVGGKDKEQAKPSPCGICLQVMAEFCDFEKFEIITAKNENEYEIRKLGEYLPYGFTEEFLR